MGEMILMCNEVMGKMIAKMMAKGWSDGENDSDV